MSGYEIGISGLHAAQKALDVIGNNIANAATEGYHRQEVILRPADPAYTNGQLIGQGVDFAGVRRRISELLDSQILSQDSTLSDMSKQLDILRSIETVFSELSSPGLSTAMDNFFSAFGELSLRPWDTSLQSTVLSSAQTLTNQFRNAASVIGSLYESTYTDALSAAEKINQLAEQIAQMNTTIYSQSVRGYDSSNLLDRRDSLLTELGQLIGISVVSREYGQVDVYAAGLPLVNGTNASELEVRLLPSDGNYNLALAPKDTELYVSQVSGGQMGGLFALRNDILFGLSDDLDGLAEAVISEVNKLHAQGVGSLGSFTDLTGWTLSQTNISDFVPPVSDGVIYVRVTAPDGTVARYEVAVSASDTVQDIADALAAVPGLEDNTALEGGRLKLAANSGYKFDFLGGILPAPTALNLNPPAAGDSPVISISGIYTGTENQKYTCRVDTVPPGQSYSIGSGTMTLTVEDGAGNPVATLNIGEGYEAGTELSAENGIKIKFSGNGTSPGYLTDGDSFQIDAAGSSDTSGFLAAAGINCFFSGSDANSIGVSDYAAGSGGRIAFAAGWEGNDVGTALAISRIGKTSLASLGQLSPAEYYRGLVVGIGEKISLTEMRCESADGIGRSLRQQRDEASGVDINDQAMQMLMFERIFGAMAKYMNTVSDSLDTIMSLLS